MNELDFSEPTGSFLRERYIPKDQIAIIQTQFGERGRRDLDSHAFLMASLWSGYNCQVLFDIPSADEIEKAESLKPIKFDLIKELKVDVPLVVFVIATPQSARRQWMRELSQGMRKYRFDTRGIDDTAVYKIIMGGCWNHKEYLREDPEGHYWGTELSAHDLGGYDLYYNSDAPTSGNYRLVEFMNRLLGRDLSAPHFPAYSNEEIKRIAWNINREDFNAISSREGAIPKYPIDPVSGRPVFPF